MTIQNLQEGIAQLEAIDPKGNQAYEKAMIALFRIQRIPFLILEIEPPLSVFKTRTHEDPRFFTSVSDIALPPQHVVKSFARCNRPGQPMFYCSDTRPTSYFELVESWASGKAVGDHVYVTISKWEITKSIRTLIVTSPYPNQRVSKYDQQQGEALDFNLGNHYGEEKEAMIIFYQYMFERFRKRAKNDPLTYIITSAYCNLAYCKATGALDAIYYPSVPFQHNGVNFAFNADFDFSTGFSPILIARNKMRVTDLGPTPAFQEAELIQAQSINSAEGSITW